ncbi:hypothetical protein AB1K83_13430 [Sporosarcina sp. 179-K 3D1 HS]|uniref:hypothetical protein n=1 Tax=Sporosarcina sp. 179-K 3D1 HS TaxID=3232169 RepID=UPI0039A3A61D
MKKWTTLLLLVLGAVYFITGCAQHKSGLGAQSLESPPADLADQMATEEVSIEELLAESDFQGFLAERCGELTTEFTQFYATSTDARQTLVGYCHHDGNTELEMEEVTIAVASFNEEKQQWVFQVVVEESLFHIEEELGLIEVDEGQSGVVFRKSPSKAEFGMTTVAVVYKKDDHFAIEFLTSDVVQSPDITLAGNLITMEDKQVKETFTFTNGKAISEKQIKEQSVSADIVVSIDMNENEELYGSIANGGHLPVKPGDTVLIKRKSPFQLTNFQIRADVDWLDQEAGLFRVRKEDMGKSIEIGNYPFDEMIHYTIGTPERSDFAESFLTKDFYHSLVAGNMPGATINFKSKRDEVYEKLGSPDEEFGWKGANYLRYGQYAYSVAFPFADDFDGIYTIYREIPESESIMGSDVIEAWGKPDEESYGEQPEEGIRVLSYHNAATDVYVQGPQADSLVIGIEMWNKER